MSVQIFQWQSQLALAKNALISGDYLTAEEYLTAAMTFSHDENAPEVAVADIFYHRGVCFENKDRFVDARRAFNQAQHTFSRCLGATSSQALKAGKAKCLVDIKMGRTAEAQSEFQEIMQLLKSDPGDFTAEIVAMETEMRQMLAHPEPPAMPGTEVEIEPYAESWTPVRRTAEFVPPAVTQAPAPEAKSDRKVSMPAEVSDAIAHLSKSGQMAAVPESYLTGGVTERLTSIGNKRPNPVVESSPDSEFHIPSVAEAAAESARVAAAEAARKAADEESRLAQIEIQRVAAEEESRFAAAENARIAAEEEAARQVAGEAERVAAEAEATRAAAEAARIATEEEEARAVAEAARIAAEEESTRAAQAESARIASEEESARAAVEAARIASEEEAARSAAEAARIAAEQDACRAAEAEAARIAGEEESARIAQAEAARIASEEEAARATEAETARIAAEEESTRTAQAEVARIVAEEEEAAAAEAASKTQEESARTEAEEAARKAADEESARLAAEAAAATEAARIASEDAHRDTVANIARKAEEIEQARNAAADAARKAAEEQEKNAAATEAAKKAADEAARIEAEELARKTDEEARRAAAESRRAAEEEVRLASAEAARKAREEKTHAAESAKTSTANDYSRNAGLSSEFEFDSTASLTGQSLSNDLHESWALMPLETPEAAADPNASSAQIKDADLADLKVRIVRSQPEAFVQKRLDGTMIDMPARKPPGIAPQEPHLSFVKAQTPYPSELNRRVEPPVKPDDQPERRQSLLSQVADELAGQLAGQIEARSSEKIATDEASYLAAQVHEVAQANEHLVAQAAASAVTADPFKPNVESSTWSEVVAKSQGNSSPVAAAAAASPLFAPQVEAPSPVVFSRPPDLTPVPDKPAANSPAVAWEPQPTVTDNRLEPVGEQQKRPYTKTMMDMSAAGVQEQAFLAANPPAKSIEVVKDSVPAKNVDIAKVNEFQQRLSESARVNPPLPAPPALAKDASSPADDGPITELSPYSGNAPSADDRFDRSKRPSTSSRNPKVVQPVSQLKSLITPRQFIRPINIPELTNAREPMYAKVSTILGALLYLASVICIFGIIAIPLMMAIKFARDGIKLGRIRGKGIRVTPEQFPEVFETVHNLAASLGMPTAPDTYIVHEQGHLTVSAQRLHGKNLVVVYADVLELAYSFGESELAFIISHELAHIQCGHLNRWFIDFPAKRIPFVGAALLRAREYTCDRIAQELVPEGAAMGLVALSAGTKLYRRINLKALYAQQDADDDFWTRFSETLSNHPNLNNRIKALGPVEDKNKPGKPVATAPSKRY